MGKLNTYISSNQAWSMKEQLFLSQNYFKLPLSELSLKLNRSQGSITAKASDMGLNVNSMKKTKQQTYTVQKYIPVAPTPARESKLVDSPNLVTKKIGTRWTEYEEDFIRNNPKMKNREIAKSLNRDYKSVKDKKYCMKKTGALNRFPVIAYIPELKDKPVVEQEIVSKAVEFVSLPVCELYPLEAMSDVELHASEQVLTVGIDSLTVKTLTNLTNYLESIGIKYTIKTQKV